jgi:biopolymer transport protein ExbD
MASKAVKEYQNENMEMQMTSLIDMSFLLIIFFVCLPMKTLEGKLEAFLPTNKGINPTPTEPPPSVKVTVHIVARKEVPTLYPPTPEKGPKPAGQISVNMPTEFRYKCGNNEGDTSDLREVAAFIRKAYDSQKNTPGVEILGELKAGHKVPHKYVIAVLNKFAEAGMKKVDFYGTAVPPKSLRTLATLPYPTKNYETSD